MRAHPPPDVLQLLSFLLLQLDRRATSFLPHQPSLTHRRSLQPPSLPIATSPPTVTSVSMSRLTAPLPSHLRSSSHPDPHRPPSPPDTDMEAYGTPRRKQAPQPLMMAHPDRPASPGFSETASRSIRRGPSSSLPYTNTGIKDRRRSIKQTRWLVVVIPPPSFTANSPSSPSGGSNNGVLMPLYSTVRETLLAPTCCAYRFVIVLASQPAQCCCTRLRSPQHAWRVPLSPDIRRQFYVHPEAIR